MAAKSVRYRVALGKFHGFCQYHANASAGASRARPSHAAVDWERGDRLHGPAWTIVTCPVCGQERVVSAKQVRKQIRTGHFTGRCRRDKGVGSGVDVALDRPSHAAVDWTDERRVGGRRRVAVICPVCGERRYASGASVRYQLHWNRLTGLCNRHGHVKSGRLLTQMAASSPMPGQKAPRPPVLSRCTNRGLDRFRVRHLTQVAPGRSPFWLA